MTDVLVTEATKLGFWERRRLMRRVKVASKNGNQPVILNSGASEARLLVIPDELWHRMVEEASQRQVSVSTHVCDRLELDRHSVFALSAIRAGEELQPVPPSGWMP